MYKEKKLIIEDISLLYLGREILFFHFCFKVNIMAIWQYENLL